MRPGQMDGEIIKCDVELSHDDHEHYSLGVTSRLPSVCPAYPYDLLH